jgi:hypothetical protein
MLQLTDIRVANTKDFRLLFDDNLTRFQFLQTMFLLRPKHFNRVNRWFIDIFRRGASKFNVNT